MKRAFKGTYFILAVLLVIFAIATALSFTGCGGQQTAATPETQSSGTETGPEDTAVPEEAEEVQTAEPSSTGFQADGTISEGEYKYSASFEGFDLSWSNDPEFVYVAMKAETGGYVSVAVQPQTTMNNADIIIGWVKEGQPGITDMYSTGNFGPHPPDTELGGTYDILEFGGSEEGGFTIIEFKRALKTQDQYDNELVRGANQVIWAYATSDDPGTKHGFRGYGEITID